VAGAGAMAGGTAVGLDEGSVAGDHREGDPWPGVRRDLPPLACSSACRSEQPRPTPRKPALELVICTKRRKRSFGCFLVGESRTRCPGRGDDAVTPPMHSAPRSEVSAVLGKFEGVASRFARSHRP